MGLINITGFHLKKPKITINVLVQIKSCVSDKFEKPNCFVPILLKTLTD